MQKKKNLHKKKEKRKKEKRGLKTLSTITEYFKETGQQIIEHSSTIMY